MYVHKTKQETRARSKYISRDKAGRACLTKIKKPAGSLISILIHVESLFTYLGSYMYGTRDRLVAAHIDSPIHALASLYISFTLLCYTSLAVDSHTVHFQTTTRNKRMYEPVCCAVSNT